MLTLEWIVSYFNQNLDAINDTTGWGKIIISLTNLIFHEYIYIYIY